MIDEKKLRPTRPNFTPLWLPTGYPSLPLSSVHLLPHSIFLSFFSSILLLLNLNWALLLAFSQAHSRPIHPPCFLLLSLHFSLFLSQLESSTQLTPLTAGPELAPPFFLVAASFLTLHLPVHLHLSQVITELFLGTSSPDQVCKNLLTSSSLQSYQPSSLPRDEVSIRRFLPLSPLPFSSSTFTVAGVAASPAPTAYTVMAQNSFPGTNPFLDTSAKEKNPNIQKISEEEEFEVTSPTDVTFKQANTGGAAIFGGSAFAEGGSPAGTGAGASLFGRSPFDSGPRGGADGGDNEQPAALPTGSAHHGFPNNYALGRRTSVSAESLNPTSAGSDSWTPPHHPKTEDQLARLKTAVSNNFLFSHLDDDQFKTVLDALVEKPIPAKDIKVISQGDAGDYFYIVEKGHFDIYIHPSGSVQPGPDGLGNKVTSTGPGGSFGELALMYNAPRAATVISTDAKSTLWALDRITFRRILMDSAFQRRRMYEAFLEEVPLLSSLKPYERSKIADALEPIKYPAGATIITEGDPGDAFYLLEAGEAEAFKNGVSVKNYSRGDYFGELALLDDKPRAASIITKTDVKVARLGRDGFKRLLGPVEDIMRRTEYQLDAANTPVSK